MRLRAPALALVVALLAAGCGKGSGAGRQPVIGASGNKPEAAQTLGFPQFATKNTTRIGGAGAVADSAAKGSTSDHVVVASADAPAYSMPAAAWAAKSGDPVLFVTRTTIPAATLAALRRHQQPKIYVLGPPAAVGAAVVAKLRRLGKV